MADKRQYYNVHSKASRRPQSVSGAPSTPSGGGQGTDSSTEGLGRLPRNIKSVGSLLLFNTSENP